jgi:hypothetical protein
MRKDCMKGKKGFLHCYASGDGSLSFCWQDAEGKASGNTVTLAEARRFLKRKSEKHLLYDHAMVPCNLHGHVILAHRVTRLDKDTLRIHGEGEYSHDGDFKVKIDESLRFADGSLGDHAIALTFTLPKFPELGERICQNINICAAIRFFLNNEEKLTKVFAETPEPPPMPAKTPKPARIKQEAARIALDACKQLLDGHIEAAKLLAQTAIAGA